MTEPTWDWLLVAIAEARWVCLSAERPRVWTLAVDYCVITYDLEVVPRTIASKVQEAPGAPTDQSRLDTLKRMRQGRQWMFTTAQQMIQDGHTQDGIRFTKVMAPSIATPYRNAQRAIRHADRAFDQTVEVIGDLRNPTRWGLRHLPTGTTIYFNVLKPLHAMTAQDKHAMVEQAMQDLGKAVKERAGVETMAGPAPLDPGPTLN